MKDQRIILVGRAASGKNYLQSKFIKRGFKENISFTTREPRDGEKDGVHYHFITQRQFSDQIETGKIKVWESLGGDIYGISEREWENKQVFIMTPTGINSLSMEDRKTCFIIYIDPPKEVLIERMKNKRGMTEEKLRIRFKLDDREFVNFKKYDIRITNSDF